MTQPTYTVQISIRREINGITIGKLTPPATEIKVTRPGRIEAIAEALAMVYAHVRPDVDRLVDEWKRIEPILREAVTAAEKQAT